jgi:hypothetical protein
VSINILCAHYVQLIFSEIRKSTIHVFILILATPTKEKLLQKSPRISTTKDKK